MKCLRTIIFHFAITLAPPITALADNGHYAPGVEGLGGAQVPAPGLYYRAYSTHYDIKSITNSNGRTIPGNNTGHVSALTSRLVWITDHKLLGADYGVEIIVPLLKTSLKFRGQGLEGSENGMGDIFVSPLVLGWHGQQWDAVAAAGLWLDNANFSKGNPASLGKGYRTTMLTLGGSWHFDSARRWSLSVLSRYEINSKQERTGIRPGENWLMEWGLGHRLKNGLELGVVGYDSWQLESDRGAPNHNKSEKHAVGLEAAYMWPELGVGVNAALYHEYHVKAGRNGTTAKGNSVRLVLTKAF